MLMAAAQFFTVMCGKIDDCDPAAHAEDPRRFGQWQFWFLRKVEHLVKQHRIKTFSGKAKVSEIALNQLDLSR